MALAQAKVASIGEEPAMWEALRVLVAAVDMYKPASSPVEVENACRVLRGFASEQARWLHAVVAVVAGADGRGWWACLGALVADAAEPVEVRSLAAGLLAVRRREHASVIAELVAALRWLRGVVGCIAAPSTSATIAADQEHFPWSTAPPGQAAAVCPYSPSAPPAGRWALTA